MVGKATQLTIIFQYPWDYMHVLNLSVFCIMLENEIYLTIPSLYLNTKWTAIRFLLQLQHFNKKSYFKTIYVIYLLYEKEKKKRETERKSNGKLNQTIVHSNCGLGLHLPSGTTVTSPCIFRFM